MRRLAAFACVCAALVLAGCKERPRPADQPATPPQPVAAEKPAPVDQVAVASQPHDTGQPAAAQELDDAEGFYLPRARIVLGALDRDSIVAFSLDQLGSIVKADYTGHTRVTHCSERVATQDTLHLLCVDPVLGTVRIDGHFLGTRVLHGILPKTVDDDLVDAVVTVTRIGRVPYSQRHRFFWGWGE